MGSTSSKTLNDSGEKDIMDSRDFRFGFSGKKLIKLESGISSGTEDEKEFLEVLLDSPLHLTKPLDFRWSYTAAGWPSWLVEVAFEAIRGWIPRGTNGFKIIGEIGQGTYSNVYMAYDILDGKYVALKKMKFDHLDPESIKFMAREILILRSLKHPNVIQLENVVISDSPRSLYLVLEYMEHDLTGIASHPGVKFTEPQIKCYMHQLLSGLEYCHSRGVLHRDVKCSNLLLDNHGNLKIADFGLSTFFDNNQNYALTSRVGTLWYRPPELLLGQIHYGVEVDLWSAGCVFGELCAGKPIMHGKTEVEQLHKIFKLCGSPSDDYWKNSKLPTATIFKPQVPYRRCVAETFKDVSAAALGLLETLLSLQPDHRGTAASALQNQFFTTEPLACDPSTLPICPPGKEADARLRQRHHKSPRILGAPRAGYGKRESRNQHANQAPDANAHSSELVQNNHQRLKETAQGGARFEKARDIEVKVSEQDSQIQESADRLRHEKRRGNKTKLQKRQVEDHSSPYSVSVCSVDDLLEEHDRQIQEATERMILDKKKRHVKLNYI